MLHVYSPAAHGFDARRLTRIHSLMQRYLDEGKMAGMVTLVARHGKIVHLDTHGYADIASQKPMTVALRPSLKAAAADYFPHHATIIAQCLLNGGELEGQRILGRKTVEFMRSNALTPQQMPVAFEGLEPFAGFGYGVCVKVMQDPAAGGWMGSLGDFGWGGYAETYHFIDPAEELIGLMMIQCVPSMHYPIRKEFRMAVHQALV